MGEQLIGVMRCNNQECGKDVLLSLSNLLGKSLSKHELESARWSEVIRCPTCKFISLYSSEMMHEARTAPPIDLSNGNRKRLLLLEVPCLSGGCESPVRFLATESGRVPDLKNEERSIDFNFESNVRCERNHSPAKQRPRNTVKNVEELVGNERHENGQKTAPM
jgi:hypothetical protein